MSEASDWCPHCVGLRARITLLERELGVSDAVPKALGLTKTETEMLALMIKRERVTRAGLMTALYGLLKAPPDAKIFDVYVCRLRAKLKPFDIAIQTDWGVGWFIRSADKKRLAEMRALERSAA